MVHSPDGPFLVLNFAKEKNTFGNVDTLADNECFGNECFAAFVLIGGSLRSRVLRNIFLFFLYNILGEKSWH